MAYITLVVAGIETAISCHHGDYELPYEQGRIEVAQRIAGHSNAKTTVMYDRRKDEISFGEVERIGIFGM
jgi:integrase/recombinase XerD